MSRFEVIVRRSAVRKSMGKAGRLSGLAPSETGIAKTWPADGGSSSWDGWATGGGSSVWESPADARYSKSRSAPRSNVRKRAELSQCCATVFPNKMRKDYRRDERFSSCKYRLIEVEWLMNIGERRPGEGIAETKQWQAATARIWRTSTMLASEPLPRMRRRRCERCCGSTGW